MKKILPQNEQAVGNFLLDGYFCSMIDFPNAKINLGLRVIRKRTDGYHDIQTLFFPVGLSDVLEIVPNHAQTANIEVTGLVPEGDPQSNLCMKVWEILHKEKGIPGVDMYLHKQIPSGAGLGGGSSDAAFALKMLDRLFDLSLTEEQLKEYAVRIGSDCPFFLYNCPMAAQGRGEVLSRVGVDLNGYYLVLVIPPLHVPTREAYAQITPAEPPEPVQKTVLRNIELWREHLVNDFEEPAFKKYPLLADIKNRLYQAGAVYASMSGSGSALYGLFTDKPEVHALSEGNRIFIEKIGSMFH